MKAAFAFAGINLNSIVQKKRQTTARFMDGALKTRNQGHQKYLRVETRFVFSPSL